MKMHAIVLSAAALMLVGCATPESRGGWTTLSRAELHVDMTVARDGASGAYPTFSCERSLTNRCYITVVDACPEGSAPCSDGASEQFVLEHFENKTLKRVREPLFFCASAFETPSVKACRDAQAADRDGTGGVVLDRN